MDAISTQNALERRGTPSWDELAAEVVILSGTVGGMGVSHTPRWSGHYRTAGFGMLWR
jgi:hypothetical protein